MEKKNKPAIRFKGFEEDWKEDTILNVSPLQRSFDLPKAKMKDGIFPVVMSNGINDFHNEYKAFGPGVVTGRSGTIGNVHFVNSNFWPHNTSLWVTDFKGNYQLFIYNILSNLNLSKFGTGSGVPTLNRNDVHQQKVCIPKYEEQINIANFFENIDQLITQHQQKHSKLLALKKAMLSKMFPKQGQTVPEIRFKGFEGDWVEKNVGIICSTTIGVFVIKTKQNDLSPYPVYNGGISYTGFYDEYNNEPNKIVISARGANAGFVNIVKTKYWAGNSCYSVDVLDKESFDIDFLFYYIKENQSRFLENQQAANIPSVSKSDVERFLIFHPTKSEQTVIAKYLLSLDNLISNHQTQMTKLQNIKKALLAKMFV